MYLWCVSSWRLFFKVNRSNLSVESLCFSVLEVVWAEESMSGHFQEAFLYVCVQVWPCVKWSCPCCSVWLLLLCISFLFEKAMSICFLWNMCLALWFWSDYSTIDGYVYYLGICLLFCLLNYFIIKMVCYFPHRQLHVRNGQLFKHFCSFSPVTWLEFRISLLFESALLPG